MQNETEVAQRGARTHDPEIKSLMLTTTTTTTTFYFTLKNYKYKYNYR